ncbi:MAG: thioredoxin [Bacteroides sp.]|nr:thioredoxin [Bacteroides sp.]MDD2645693.1 thioredoxin [Bacteroides sp.]MDD4055176.1 thioredoxin [Bacteroides sp.]MDD4720384.1 thioredoxin [Bacteroides sp.]NLI64758.1 thioredoxin [Bacteroidales bacterium]
MKKRFLPIIAFVFGVLLVVGCGGNKASSSDSTETTEVTAGGIAHLTQAEFVDKVSETTEWNFKGNKPMLVDFYATWCPPCKKIAPILEELAKEYDGKVDFYKIDVDQEPELSKAYGIKSIPTLFFINSKGEKEEVVGGLSKEEFKAKIDILF